MLKAYLNLIVMSCKMKNRYQVAISAGLLTAVWCGIADIFHLVTWVGFAGCSTYFAQGRPGFQGVLLTWGTNLSGVFWAWVVFASGDYIESALLGYTITGITSAIMCLQASNHKLAFIPGAFIGCFSTFAMQGDIAAVVLPLMLGALLGYVMVSFTQPLVLLTDKCKQLIVGTKSTQFYTKSLNK